MAASDFHAHGFVKDVVHHNYASVVALTVVVWDCLTTLEDEVRYIWLSPWSKTKCTYLFARYYAVVYLTANILVSLAWPSLIPVSRSRCVGWYLQSMSSFCAQYIASHITLSRRILAAYEVRNMGSALLVFHVAELAGTLLSGKDTLSIATFDGVCNIRNLPKDMFLFVITLVGCSGMLLLGQILMWALILGIFRRREGRDAASPPFREMVGRMWHDGDAKIAWAACCSVLVANTYRATHNQKVKPVYLFAWPICLLSIGTCRYILSMERNANIRPGVPLTELNTTEELPSECGCSRPCDTHSSVDRPQHILVSRPGCFETPSPSSPHHRGSSGVQRVPDNFAISRSSTTGVYPDLTRQVSSSASTTSASTRNRSSISSHATEDTNITVPSISARTSVDIDIGSLHSSSSVTSDELREFWNDVWSGDSDEDAFRHI